MLLSLSGHECRQQYCFALSIKHVETQHATCLRTHIVAGGCAGQRPATFGLQGGTIRASQVG